ncbi:hypothetical protein QQ045_026446 [Rhodiola kirilowii]
MVDIHVEHDWSCLEKNGEESSLILANDIVDVPISLVLPNEGLHMSVNGEGHDEEYEDDEDCECEGEQEGSANSDDSNNKRLVDDTDDGLTDFSDIDIARDNDDIFCVEDSEFSKVKENVSQSLNGILIGEGSTSNMIEKVDDEDFIPSDELVSCGSDSDDKDYPFFNEKLDFGKGIDLNIGLQFRNAEVFRRALREYALQKKFDYDFINNKKSRIIVQCRSDKCPWRISASEQVDRNGGKCFQIKSMHPQHLCSKERSNSKLTAAYLASYYLENFRDNPKWDTDAFMKHIKREFEVVVSYRKCLRAKTMALAIIDGAVGEQFKLIKSYCAAIRQWNPESSVHLTTDAGHFQRIYICLDACKRGFLAGCRPIISLDACHLKGAYTGRIHAAVGRDGNDNMFPIAYAICEAESKDTWHWFIQNLLIDIGNARENGWCFISDQQKGLQEALKELCPHSAHRFCVRHLYANFRKVFKGKQLKDAMWACSRASTVAQFQKAMNYLKELDSAAYTHLLKLDPSYWSKHAFGYFVKSDAVCSNISECFNSYIKVARDQPIITCLETIRRLLMKRFYEKRIGIEKYSGNICPRINQKLQENIRDSMHCNVIFGGGPAVEVEHTIHGIFMANIHLRSCSCRIWDLTGIP